jgi:(p)ppGpp synthase/HD superfamily hydrolase
MTESSTHLAPTPSQRAAEALDLARDAHSGQRRKQSGDPFIEHPVAVAKLLSDAGYDGAAISAAYLHDVVEKTDIGLDEIDWRFGHEVAELVDALSEDASVQGYAERKRALRAAVLASGRLATVIYAADRVANLNDWTALPAERREPVADALGTSLEERLRLWEEDLAELTAYDPELPFLGELEIALRELQR